jgi:hypothetical protein
VNPVDEVHGHADRDVWDVLAGSRPRGLVLEVPGVVPQSPNAWVGRSHWAYRTQKDRWIRLLLDAWMVALAVEPALTRSWPRPPTTRVRCTVERITPRKDALDLDNAYGSVKPLLDSLRYLRLIADDTAAVLELVVRQPKGAPKQRDTRIALEVVA